MLGCGYMATTASCLAEELPAGTVIQIERPDVRQKRLYHLVKRVFDAVCALLGLLLLALPMLLIALIVALDSPGPAIFRQERLGHLLYYGGFGKYLTV